MCRGSGYLVVYRLGSSQDRRERCGRRVYNVLRWPPVGPNLSSRQKYPAIVHSEWRLQCHTRKTRHLSRQQCCRLLSRMVFPAERDREHESHTNLLHDTLLCRICQMCISSECNRSLRNITTKDCSGKPAATENTVCERHRTCWLSCQGDHLGVRLQR